MEGARSRGGDSACETLMQAPVSPQIIDKDTPTAGLLAQVLVTKYADHLPLYRQEGIFARAGLSLPRSILAQWVGLCGAQIQPLVDALKEEILAHPMLHADETPVAMLSPDNKKMNRPGFPRHPVASQLRQIGGVHGNEEVAATLH